MKGKFNINFLSVILQHQISKPLHGLFRDMDYLGI
jgi:hypothetical protein